ncbi:solute carrier family 13 (sodium-dependent dicarboxylate transporter), member 2/3/5 [Halopseudomonas litoralis]|uniref:Solute carrier family 13 (Sodium-dependent dicarboxylate transporter), member 2/3/5 n=1 Tax=Halopseudomonas litoralis TaxID=797277 RepID=A0A1H1NHD9_9GAMM|nr:DASS family sodium-coupled anion symporter [Halopseudomonas litoralis]SDR98362.1 solute carrier family 13 (sodium-dependent dicarboxylate transporter), member 2/3/5 [Halopseudomonas litoralis]
MSATTTSQSPSNGWSASRIIGLLIGAALLAMTILIPAPAGMSEAAWKAGGLMMLLAAWWATEAIPIPATSLVPIVLIPALGLGSVGQATAPYANPTIFLFMGGFVLGLAMQRWNLHKRIALMTLLAVGTKPSHQIGGFMIATAFLSMWVSNTATAIMMLPIGLSVVSMFENEDPAAVRKYATALLLAIAYAASLGGVGTIIGTPPNALLVAYLADNHDIHIGFGQWMLIGVPISILMLATVWLFLARKDFGLSADNNSRELLQKQLNDLGSMSRGEKRVGIVFLLTAAAWIFQPLISESLIPWLNDTIIAIASAIIMFLIPVDREKGNLMDWDTASKMPWGVLLLFGGGLTLASVITSSGLAVWIAESMSAVGTLPTLAIVLIITAVIIFLTEITSNTATAAAFLPLMGALAMAQDVSPILYAVPAAVAASCAFMMPVATPPNAIVFGTGHMKISDMITAGFKLNLAGVVIVGVVAYYLMFWVFGI